MQVHSQQITSFLDDVATSERTAEYSESQMQLNDADNHIWRTVTELNEDLHLIRCIGWNGSLRNPL